MTKIDDTQKNGYAEPEIAVTATAIPQQSYDAAAPTGAAASGDTGGPPIPAGHSRYYCSKCHTPYDLPDRATSWRCQNSNCMTFNSTAPGECEWCSIL